MSPAEAELRALLHAIVPRVHATLVAMDLGATAAWLRQTLAGHPEFLAPADPFPQGTPGPRGPAVGTPSTRPAKPTTPSPRLPIAQSLERTRAGLR